MENLIFSMNATLPIFLLIVLGIAFRRLGIVSESFAMQANSFVFKVSIPALLFVDLATVDFLEVWDTGFVLFCLFATLACIGTAAVLAVLLCKPQQRGEFIQASYRSSAALLGIAFIMNIYGTTGMASLMIIGAVPLYNAGAVVILELLASRGGGNGSGSQAEGGSQALPASLSRAAKGIATNPIILSIVAGMAWSVLGLPLPGIAASVFEKLGSTAAPLGLVAMGAMVNFERASALMKPAAAASFLKLVGFALIALPFAVHFGFRAEKLVAILVMLGSATTVAAFTMARGMGHEGTLTSTVVMITTLLSPVTLAAWLFVLKSFALI